MVWEERWHPLRREWVVIVVAPQRPAVDGRDRRRRRRELPAYDPTCYLCPGNARVSGRRNDDYTGVFVFDNDHPCVGPSCARGDWSRRQASIGIASGHRTVARRLLHAAPRSDARRAVARRDREVCCDALQDAASRSVGAARGARRADVREQGRSRRRQQPASALSDLRDELRLQDDGDRSGGVRASTSRASAGRSFRTSSRPRSRTADACSRRASQALSFVPYFARYAYETYVAPRESHAQHRRPRRRRARRLRRGARARRSCGSTICGGCRFRT